MDRETRLQWYDYFTDYRCQRPPVQCGGCGRHYEPNQHAGVMIYSGYELVSCGNCEKPKVDDKTSS